MKQIKPMSLQACAASIMLAFCVSPNQSLAQAFAEHHFGAHGVAVRYQIDPATSQTEGSPYYNEEWRKGTVYFKNGTFSEVDQMKYNAHIDALIFIFEGRQYIVPGKEQIKRFTLGDDEFVGAFDGSKYSFYKVLEKGEGISLLMRMRSSIVKGEPSKGYIPATKDKFVTKESTYVRKPDADAVDINAKRGISVLSFMTDKRDEMEQFIKAEKLRMKSIEDLLTVIRQYNALTANN